ncbi:MAG: helix-hairpin-helix domain-containing protein [Bacteroidetes bacterium]|nr:helix-hairpin-helix domain-containing protein [Bacteroidota bacterium]
MIRILPLLFCLFSQTLTAQIDSVETSDILVEDILQNNIETSDLDHNTLFEGLEYFRENPLDLNTASREDLEEIRLLSDIQIDRFLSYRLETGELISIYELQAIPGFDLISIKNILPFVKVGGNLDDFRQPLGKMLVQGDNRLFLRWSTNLEPYDGEINPDPDRQFLGDPNRYYLRYKHTFENRLYYGLTAEKDPGEALFGESNPYGFDYYSAHFYLRNYRSWMPDLALGDFRVSLGQGLIAYSGFGYGKSADAVRILRPSRPLGPYASVNEVDFFRGAAVRLRPIENLELTLFGSINRVDARLDDTTFQNDIVSSIIITGFHRIPSEAASKRNIVEFSQGGSVKWKGKRYHLAFNLINSGLSAPLQRDNRLYNRFYFQGDRLLNMSVDYDWRWKGLHGFGEVAMSDNGAIAHTNGLLAAVNRQLDVALLYRDFAYNFQTLHGDAFAETRETRNEQGIYAGFTWRPQKGWLVNGYYDLYKHPWLRYLIDSPSRGSDWLLRLERFKKRTWRIYLQIRGEAKEFNVSDNEGKTDYISEGRWFSTRLHFEYKITKSLELRSRIGWRTYNPAEADQSQGWMAYQDVIYRPRSFPLSFSARYALFETDDYNTRFYNFENDLLYQFSIPAYYDRGSRFYINTRFRATSDLVVEFRFARLFLPNRESIGAGPYKIDSNRRTELKAQIAWKF